VQRYCDPTNSTKTKANFDTAKKREGEKTPEGACAASATCIQVAPDQLFLADGQKYNIVDMDTGLLEELTGLMENGSIKADIPAVFKTFEISA